MPAVIVVHPNYVLLHKTFGKKHVLFPELKSKKTVFRCKTLEITASYTSTLFSPIFSHPKDFIDPLGSDIC